MVNRDKTAPQFHTINCFPPRLPHEWNMTLLRAQDKETKIKYRPGNDEISVCYLLFSISAAQIWKAH